MKNDIVTVVLMLAIFVLFYATTIMPQRRREKQLQEMQSGLKVGDEVTTFSGVIAKIINISNDTLTIETGPDKTKINIYKWAVKGTINKNK